MSELLSCKGCEGFEELFEDGFCGYCRNDIQKGHRDEDSGDLTEEGERYYKDEQESVEAYPKNCTKCDKGIWEGYQIETFKGVDYFCSDACAFNKGYTKEQYLKDYAEGGDTYWTEWEVSA